MKKILLLIIICILMHINWAIADKDYGENKIPICVINNELIQYDEIYGEIKKNRIYIPLKVFAKGIGADIRWSKETALVTMKKNNNHIEFDLKSKTMLNNKNVLNINSFYIKEDICMVPIRIISSYFNYKIKYNEEYNYVRMYNVIDSREKDEFINIKEKVLKERKYIKAQIIKKEEEARKAYMELKKYGKVAYITFDDGPGKYSAQILSILKRYNAKATFFMLSNRISAYETIVKKQLEYGNSVGLHGVSHNIKVIYSSPKNLVSEMITCNDTLEKITGIRTNIVRVPYGSSPYMKKNFRNAITKAGYKVWDWNIDSKDSLNTNVKAWEIINEIKNTVHNHRQPVILFHERKATVEALPAILEYLHKEGYTLLPIEKTDKPFNFWPYM